MADIIVTQTLLHKPENELSDNERKAIASYKKELSRRVERLAESNERIRKDCRILCSGRFTEHDLIPEYGWIDSVTAMAYKLEKLNYFYSKWNMKVRFSQTKEKFGTFRGYWYIDHEKNSVLARIFRKVRDYMTYGIDYAQKRVVDIPMRVSLEWEECSEDIYRKKLDRYGKKVKKFEIWKESEIIGSQIYIEPCDYPRDVTYFKYDQSNKKYYRSYWLHHGESAHMEATKHRFMFKILPAVNRIYAWFNDTYGDPDPIENVMYENFYNEITQAVRECETDCGRYCQVCGRGIGENHFSSKCETDGWITYVCETCAAASGHRYYNHSTKKWMDAGKVISNPYKSDKFNKLRKRR